MGSITYIISRLLKKKKFSKNITFKQHFFKTGKKLVITGTCVNENKLYYFNYINNPNMKIITSILISCCIPVLFTPIKYKKKLWVDGGILNNYPINYFYKDIENTIGIAIFNKC